MTTLTVTTPSDREIVLTRLFDAPRHQVFDAMTNAELVRRWLSGPPGWSLVACEIDLSVGGTYRYAWRGPDGIEMGVPGIASDGGLEEPPAVTMHSQRHDARPINGGALMTMHSRRHDTRPTPGGAVVTSG